ncbi:MAG TPA: hypothetical protein VK843_08900 [Planctomycetota bacterium]|nr:hypothetical protein [Planctomycetota bacterium]
MKDSVPVSIQPLALFALITAATLVGGGAVLLVQPLLVPAPTLAASVEPGTTVTSDAALAKAMSELAQEWREGRASRAPLESLPPEPSQRSALTQSGDTAIAELAAAVRELREALQRGNAGSLNANHAAIAPPRDHRRAYLPALPAELAVGESDDYYTSQHMLWSEQQILDTYGVPDEIYVAANTRATWKYHDPDETGARSFYVLIFQGRVIAVGSGG